MGLFEARSLASTAARKAAGVAYSRTCAGLVNGLLNELMYTSGATLGCRAQLARGYETAGKRARRGIDDDARVGTNIGDVGDRPSRRRDLNAEATGHFISAQWNDCRVQLDEVRGLRGARSVLAGQCEMDLMRPGRSEFV